MINLFWWEGGTENKGIKWLAWDRMTYPKNHTITFDIAKRWVTDHTSSPQPAAKATC
jgi:hypothetical protein